MPDSRGVRGPSPAESPGELSDAGAVSGLEAMNLGSPEQISQPSLEFAGTSVRAPSSQAGSEVNSLQNSAYASMYAR